MADFENELAKWHKNLEERPDDLAALLSRANLYLEAERYTEAEADFSRVLQHDPTELAALFGRGSLYGRTGRYTEALSDLSVALEIEPSAEIFNNRANVLAALAAHEAALEDYSEAIALASDETENSGGRVNLAVYYKNRGISHRELGEYAGAIADFEEALRLQPTFAAAYVQRGLTYATMGDPVTALEDFDRAVALDPADPTSYYNRGLARRRSNDLSGAIADYSSAITYSGANPMPEALFNRAALYRATNHPAEAIADLRRLLALPELAEIVRSRAENLLSQLT